MPEPILHDTLNPAPLATAIAGSRVLVYDTVDSTNECALRIGGDGTAIVAERQTAGRGRRGRSWESAAGLGLWFSVAFELPTEGLPFGAPLAVCAALRGLLAGTDLAPRVKWPNDVLLNGKKICGMLVETRQGRIALGIGINVHHAKEDFPVGLREVATSLAIEAGQHFVRGAVLRAVLGELDKRVAVLRAGGVSAIWREWADACGMKGRLVRCDEMQGRVAAIEESGALLLETAQGMRPVPFGASVEVLET